MITLLPGSTGKINWSYDADTSLLQLRKWNFKSGDGSRSGQLAVIYKDDEPDQLNTSLLPRFEIEKPATLVLKNVDYTYNGTYTFSLQTKSSFQNERSAVVVYIASKFL